MIQSQWYRGDALIILPALPAGKVRCVLTSPPYNIGKEYERKQPLLAYLAWQREVLLACQQVMMPDSVLCYQVGMYVEDRRTLPLDLLLYPILADLGFTLWDRIIWHVPHGLHATHKLSGRHEVILVMAQGKPRLHLDAIRVPQLHPGKKHHKGQKKGELSGNPLGKNPGNVWEDIEPDTDNGVWYMPNVKAGHPEYCGHPCQWPLDLARRLLLAYTLPGELVLDPFAGVGATAVAAALLDRVSICIEQCDAYSDIAADRLQAAQQGTLRLRPAGRTSVAHRGDTTRETQHVQIGLEQHMLPIDSGVGEEAVD